MLRRDRIHSHGELGGPALIRSAEVGFTDVSVYLLNLTVAASLLVPSSEGGLT